MLRIVGGVTPVWVFTLCEFVVLKCKEVDVLQKWTNGLWVWNPPNDKKAGVAFRKHTVKAS